MSVENKNILDSPSIQRIPQETIKKPRLFKVVLLNDDYTPMDFVVALLMRYFAMKNDHAVMVMLDVHKLGKGLCGVYTREIAETKVEHSQRYARDSGHPLAFSLEPE